MHANNNDKQERAIRSNNSISGQSKANQHQRYAHQAGLCRLCQFFDI